MKHNVKQLDQFFDAARSEKPVMDDDAFASIVAKADAPDAASPKTELMTNSPISRIFTALRQQHGGMIMTGSVLTALTGMLVTGYYLATPDAEQAASNLDRKQPSFAVASPIGSVLPPDDKQEPTLAAATEEPDQVYVDVTNTDEPTKPQPFRRALQIDSLWANVKVAEVKPIEATHAEIVELGVNEDQDGKVFIIHQSKRGNIKMKLVFPPPAVMTDHARMEFEKLEADPAPVAPTMVTDGNGKKLAFFFKRESEGDNFSHESVSLTQVDGGPTPTDLPTRIESHTIEINEGQKMDINVDVEVEHNENFERMNGSDKFIYRDGLPRNGAIHINADSVMKTIYQYGFDEKMKPEDMKKFCNLDSLFDGKAFARAFVFDDSAFTNGDMNFDFNFDFDFDTDSVMQDAQGMKERAKIMRKHAIKMRINADSIRSLYMNGVKGMNFDSLRTNMRFLQRNLDQLQHLPKPPQLRGMPMVQRIDIPMMRIRMEEINNLVPVRIKDKNPNVKYNQNGLIFWYSRDKKFEEKAPATLVEKSRINGDAVTDGQVDIASVASTQKLAVSDQMIYPNPTPGRAIFKYTLTEPRQVSMAIHDLLGKQVLKISDLETKSSGTFEKELDLSSLESGVYLLVMITDSGEQITQRIVVEK